MSNRKFHDIRIRGSSPRAPASPRGKARPEERRMPEAPRAPGLFRRMVQPPRPGKPSYSRMLLWGTVCAALALLIGSFSTLFEGATVTITPRAKTIPVDTTFSARRASAAGDADLSFDVIELKTSAKREIPATEVKQVERRASGQIVIYNNYNKFSQRLIKNTRFETPDGLIYRIYESVVVPGQKVENGKTLPGSIEVTVYADAPGEKYNTGLVDFTVPGFKGTPRFASFYARGKTPIAGGFVGVVKTVSQAERKRVEEELRQEVTQQLLAAAHAQVPAGMTLFDNGVFMKHESPSDAEQEDIAQKTVTIEQKAALSAVIFPARAFAYFVARKLLSETEIAAGDILEIANIDELTFAIAEKEKVDPSKDTTLRFSLRGNPTFVWQFDEAAVRQKLAGKRKDELSSVLSQFASITKAEVAARPFWKASFPDNASDITIEQAVTK